MRLFTATRSFEGQTVNGDMWCTFDREHGSRIAVIDGAGHGPEAAKASTLACEALRENPVAVLPEALRRCHQALFGSRGAVLSILDVHDGALEFAGVGNVEGRVLTPTRSLAFNPSRGLLGLVLPTVRPTKVQLTEPWIVLLFTDGISSRFLNGMTYEDAADRTDNLPEEVIAGWGRTTDDATIVLVRSD